jgi:virulence factor
MLIGVIGLGNIASKAYLPVLGCKEGVDLALCSRSEENVHRVQSQYRIQKATTHLEDLVKMGICAAFVLSPNDTHALIGRALLEKGVDVFFEKPATLNSRETQELAELADRGGRVMMVGFNRRYAPLHVKALQSWQSRPIGMALFQKHRSNASHPHLAHQFMDDTIHQIDMLRYFCGEGEVVNTVAYNASDQLLGAASTVALVQGGYGMVITSLQAGRWQENYTLHGSGCSMLIEAFSRLHLIDGLLETIQEETYASSWETTLEGRGFTGQINHFLDCVKGRSLPMTSGWDSVKTQQMVERMISAVTYTQV